MRSLFMRYYFFIAFIILFPLALHGQNPNLPQSVLTPAQVTKDMVGQILTVQGLVVKFEPTWDERYPNSVYLRDTTGKTLQVVFWKNIEAALGAERIPVTGQVLRVRGQLNEFRNEIHLMIMAAEDMVQVAGEIREPVQTMELGSITRNNVNQVVRIWGKVVNIRPSWKPTAPDIVTISDDKGDSLNVVYWKDVKDKISPQDIPEVGKFLQLEGLVDLFRDQVQVKVENHNKIKCMEVPPSVSAPAAEGSSVAASGYPPPAPTQIASVNPATQSSPPQSSPTPAFGYSNPFTPPQTNAVAVNPAVTQSPPPQPPKGPGFYTIDRAPAVIKGPPQRPHVLFFTSQDHDPYSKDPQFLEISSKAVFVWIDYHESAHIAAQLSVKTDPTWIFYDANGYEKARNPGPLTTPQLAQGLTLITR